MSAALDFNTAGPQSAPNLDPAADARRLEDLRRLLPRHAENIVRHLFPLARIAGGEARIGDVEGERGESLSIELGGDKAGQWIDHASGGSDRGDLFTLWQAATGCTFGEAVEDLEGFTGSSVYTPAPSRARVERVKVEREAKAKEAGPEPRRVKAAEWSYLSTDGARELARVRRYDLVSEAGELVGKTFIQRGEDPAVWKAPTVNRPLYNLPGLVGQDVVVFVEGEKCADALGRLGVAATSAMGGSGAPLEFTDWSPLRGKRVLLWPDNDGPGATDAKSYVGQKFMDRVRAHLSHMGVPCALVSIPGGKPVKWDAADAVENPPECLAVLREGLARLEVAPAPANDRRLRLFSIAELASRKPPEWLVEGMVPEGSYAALVGDAGTMKSFVALGWGLSIAYGVPWLGRDVKAGPVVYVAGEGQSGLYGRIAAWQTAAGVRHEAPFFVLPQAIAMPTGELDELVAALSDLEQPPRLVVLDTLARTFGDGDENAQKDMNAFNGAVARLQAATGACVLVVHHTGKSGDVRGSSALRGAVDVMMTMDRADRRLVLGNGGKIGKQKDAEPFEDVPLTYIVVPFAWPDGEHGSSVVLVAGEAADGPGGEGDEPEPRKALPGAAAKLSGLEKSALKLAKQADGRGLSMTSFTASVKGSRSGVWKAVNSLVERGLLEVQHGDGDKVLYAIKPEE